MAALSGTLTLPDYNSVATEIPKLDSGALDMSLLGGTGDGTGLADMAPDVGGGTASAPSNDSTVFGVQQAEIASRRAAIQDAINRIQARNSQSTDIEQQPLGLLSIIANRDPNHNVTADIMAQDHMLSGIKQERMAKSDDANLQGALLQNQFLGQDQENYLKKQQIDAMAAWRQAQMAAIQAKVNSLNGGNDTVINSQNSALTGQEFLDSINDPKIKNMTQSMLEGRMAVPPINSRTPTIVRQAFEAAQQADPTFSYSTAPVRLKTAQDYAPSGNNGKVLQSIGTASGHLSDLQEAYNELGNSGFKFGNKIGNAIAGETSSYDPKTTEALGKFNTALNAVAPELAKISAGTSVVPEGEINKRRDAFSQNATPTEFNSAMKEAANLIKSRHDSMIEGYKQTMGGNLPITAPKLTPRVLKHFEDLGVDLNGDGIADNSQISPVQKDSNAHFIANAKATGYSDQEIQDHLSKMNGGK